MPYRKLQQHLDRQPVGFPPSVDGADIRLLKHVFSPQEAAIVTCLSHEPQTVEVIFDPAIHMVSSMAALKKHLTAMVKKGGIECCPKNNRNLYANVPLLVGIYELQVNRLTPEFIRDFKAYTLEKRFGISFLGTGRSQMRTIPVNKSITPDLPAAAYDQILCLLEKAEPPFVVLPCICRKKKRLQGMPCKQTRREETCMAMGSIAQTLNKMELGRQITKTELILEPANEQKKKASPFIDPDRCIGCGQCVAACRPRALSLIARSGQVPPPVNRETLNAESLACKQQPQAWIRVIGKLAKGIIVKRDFRLLKN